VKYHESTAHTAKVTLTVEELLAVNNALNEVCNGIKLGEEEFTTRIGQDREHVRKLLAEVAFVLSRMGR
jgi:hypothetical protein